jgi:carbamoyltransferase
MTSQTVLAILWEVDPSAAIFHDGELLVLGEEERFTREKHAPSQFPLESIQYVLDEASIGLEGVDKIVYGWNCEKYPLEMAEKFLEMWFEYDKNEETLQWEIGQLRSRRPEVIKRTIEQELSEISDEIPEVKFVDHHKAHAVSASYYSGFESSAVLTVDGYGEQNTVTGWKVDRERFERLFSFEIPHSLGWFMFSVTTYLGFRANNGEGKVMGLAPYGGPAPSIRDTLEEFLTITEDGFELDPSYVYYGDHSHHDRFTDKLVEELGHPPRQHGEEITEFHENFAYEAQCLLEKALISCSERLLSESGMNKLCLAGGVALNCKANMRLRETLDIEDIFIQPIASDNGIPLGAGVLATDSVDDYSSSSKMPNPYFGYRPTEDEVEEAVESRSVTPVAEGRSDVRERLVSELQNGKIVARYSGRMECGPRALGNRSIIADPSDGDNLSAVNDVKQREQWRPFAPTILAEQAEEILEGDTFDPYMIQTYDVKPNGAEKIEATVHVDDTTRPQVLTREANESYWMLIKRFHEQTGIPAVLNTSFNLSGDPIVRTPEEAIDTFQKSSIDYLQIEDYLLTEQ